MAEITRKLLRINTLAAKLDVSTSTIWYWLKNGNFPKPIKLGANSTVWLESDIEAWLQSRIENGVQ
ncbi:helix-turn-helix transcriptional regulator [Sulfurirhabdus autotrophica]|uniref:AlpA family transcriptional regulator n=1 Tax=Sulfurirhabdus autotrophica TaxID=1706046 RepID=A0A4R3Y2F1_9PROT|nr:AlpA family transcriptional regulator [Sulfurirhabdus autotrophica]TCV85870.1 AlpA family transcriptional regulator [Sulfurirhabdus autotrophica]